MSLIYALTGPKAQNILDFLSSDLIHEIADHLSPFHHRILSQVCHSLYTLLYSRCRRQVFTRQEYLDYISCLLRLLPDHWVCGHCMGTHAIDMKDAWKLGHITHQWPGSIYFRDELIAANICPSAEKSGVLGDTASIIGSRHVQIATKYSRIGPEFLTMAQKTYLESLLHVRLLQFPMKKIADQTLLATSSFIPKIVKGRYLLHQVVTWSGTNTSSPTFRQSMGSLPICSHQCIMPDPAHELQIPQIWASLILTIRAAMATPNVAVSGSCRRCAADFEVYCTPTQLHIRAWHDMGGEGAIDGWVLSRGMGNVVKQQRDSPETLPLYEANVTRSLYEGQPVETYPKINCFGVQVEQ